MIYLLLTIELKSSTVSALPSKTSRPKRILAYDCDLLAYLSCEYNWVILFCSWWSLIEKTWGLHRAYPEELPICINFDQVGTYFLVKLY